MGEPISINVLIYLFGTLRNPCGLCKLHLDSFLIVGRNAHLLHKNGRSH